MATIYVVTSDTYSDYGINGIFDSKEKAQAFIDYHKARNISNGWRDPMEIEEWQLNEYYDEISRGLKCFRVTFRNILTGDATVEETEAREDDGGTVSRADREGRKWFWSDVWTTDETTALKIANERRVRTLVAMESGQS